MDFYEGVYQLNADMLRCNENRTAFVAIKWHKRELTIIIINFLTIIKIIYIINLF